MTHFELNYSHRVKSLFLLVYFFLTFWLPFFKGIPAAFEIGPVRSDNIAERYEQWWDSIKISWKFLVNREIWVWKDGNRMFFSSEDPNSEEEINYDN